MPGAAGCWHWADHGYFESRAQGMGRLAERAATYDHGFGAIGFHAVPDGCRQRGFQRCRVTP